jgi:hypothetical protein
MSNNGPSKITAKTSQGSPAGRFPGILRAVALIALVVGAAGSLVFMFRAGQHTPRLLLFLFTIWVLSPFAALLWANLVSKRWSVLTRATLYCATIIVTLGSLVAYGDWVHLRPAGAANAFLFVAVPPVLLVFIATVLLLAAFISRRLSRPGGV